MDRVFAAVGLSQSDAKKLGHSLVGLKPWELYQFVGDLQARPRGQELQSLPQKGWRHDRWQTILKEKAEVENYDIYADIEEGIMECRQCRSKTVLYYSKRVRASDEPETIYALCGSCKHKWLIAT